MDSGMEEIRKIFESECSDALDVIEAGLLTLEGGEDNLEVVNDIFRGAHSIKGGAATFGYQNIADFTHVMETLLDEVRSDELEISPPLVKVFLESVDCLRSMVEVMDGGSYDEERTAVVQKDLSVWLDKDLSQSDEQSAGEEAPQVESAAVESNEEQDAKTAGKIWDISFTPNQGFLLTGNQPQHIFRALAELGKVTLKADVSMLPDFEVYRPEEMYLSWDIELQADVSKEQILEEFDWVETECKVEATERKEVAVEVELEVEVAAENFDRRAEDRRVDAVAGSERRQQDRRVPKKDSGSIRVDIDKIDALLNLVGEMVINQSMLNTQFSAHNLANNAGSNNVELDQSLSLLERTTRELQEAVMKIRMLPVSTTFNRYPRVVYDLSSKLDKVVELVISGENTEVDKTVLEKIGDPLLHLIRNSLDHGIESPEKRLAAGKSEKGTIHLSASHEGGSVVIRLSDDGGGLNTDKILAKAVEKGLVMKDEALTEQQINNLIFQPGFSTADVVSDVSGRGVGMDVVRNNIEEIGGRVDVQSTPGKGSIFQIKLPLTLAILDGQLVQVGSEVYVIPLLSIKETVQVDIEKLNVISGSEVIYRLRGEAIPVVDMRKLYSIEGTEELTSYEQKQLVIVESERKSVGLIVDSLHDQHQVVIKSLETNFVKVPGMLGATILGDGAVSLIVDVTTLSHPKLRELGTRIEH